MSDLIHVDIIHHNEFPRVNSNLPFLLKTSTILTISLSVKCACHRYFDANDELSWLLFLWILKCKKSKAGKWKCKEQLNGQKENKTKQSEKKVEEITNNHALFAMMMLSISTEWAYNQIWWFNASDWIWLDFISLLQHDTVVFRPRPWTLLRHPSDQSVFMCSVRSKAPSHSHSDWLLFC